MTYTSDAGHTFTEMLEDVKPYGNAGVERQNLFATNQAVSDHAMKMKLAAACGMSMKMNRSKTGGRLIGAHIKVSGSSGGKDLHYRVLDTRFVQSHGLYLSPCSLSPDTLQKEKKPSLCQGRANLLCLCITFFFLIISRAVLLTFLLNPELLVKFTTSIFFRNSIYFLATLCKPLHRARNMVKWRQGSPAIFTFILWPPRLFSSPSWKR